MKNKVTPQGKKTPNGFDNEFEMKDSPKATVDDEE